MSADQEGILAVLATGDGSKDRPWIVNSVAEEYFILSHLNETPFCQMLLDGDPPLDTHSCESGNTYCFRISYLIKDESFKPRKDENKKPEKGTFKALLCKLGRFLQVIFLRALGLLISAGFWVMLAYLTVDYFLQIKEAWWYAPDLDVIYLEPRISQSAKTWKAIVGFLLLGLTVFLAVASWRFWKDILLGRFDP